MDIGHSELLDLSTAWAEAVIFPVPSHSPSGPQKSSSESDWGSGAGALYNILKCFIFGCFQFVNLNGGNGSNCCMVSTNLIADTDFNIGNLLDQSTL